MKNLFFTLFTILLCSCASYMASYEISLAHVVSPDGTKHGKINVLHVKDSARYVYEDDDIYSYWIVGSKYITMFLQNKTNTSMSIQPGEMRYVDITGRAEPLVGIMNTIILPPFSYTDAIMRPACNVAQDMALVPCYYTSYEAMEENAPLLIGRKLRISMPVYAGGEKKEYLFTFSLDKYIADDWKPHLEKTHYPTKTKTQKTKRDNSAEIYYMEDGEY